MGSPERIRGEIKLTQARLDRAEHEFIKKIHDGMDYVSAIKCFIYDQEIMGVKLTREDFESFVELIAETIDGLGGNEFIEGQFTEIKVPDGHLEGCIV